jgi:hypothetical protein
MLEGLGLISVSPPDLSLACVPTMRFHQHKAHVGAIALSLQNWEQNNFFLYKVPISYSHRKQAMYLALGFKVKLCLGVHTGGGSQKLHRQTALSFSSSEVL